MKEIEIRKPKCMGLEACEKCGRYPEFVQPSVFYTDLWLECKCGKRTTNCGGYQYGYEISEEDAKISAINEWNIIVYKEPKQNVESNRSSRRKLGDWLQWRPFGKHPR